MIIVIMRLPRAEKGLFLASTLKKPDDFCAVRGGES